jgi:hypothetical protein
MSFKFFLLQPYELLDFGDPIGLSGATFFWGHDASPFLREGEVLFISI